MAHCVRFRIFVMLFIFSKLTVHTVTYELKIKDGKFRKFTDISGINQLSFDVDFEYKFGVAFFDEHVIEADFTIGREGYFLSGNVSTWKYFQEQLTDGILHVWFTWQGESPIRFGIGDVGLNELGSCTHWEWPLKYIAFSSHESKFANFYFPNEATFIRGSPDKRLNSTFLRIQTSISKTGCSKACLQHPECFAFNIKKLPLGNFDCQLLDGKTHKFVPFNEEFGSKWSFYFLKE